MRCISSRCFSVGWVYRALLRRARGKEGCIWIKKWRQRAVLWTWSWLSKYLLLKVENQMLSNLCFSERLCPRPNTPYLLPSRTLLRLPLTAWTCSNKDSRGQGPITLICLHFIWMKLCPGICCPSHPPRLQG